LGLANYYKHFIQNFSAITALLSALVHDSASDCVEWTLSLNDAFTHIKQVLTQAPVLGTYDPALKCILVTDASSSHEAIGEVLMQDDRQGPGPIEYYSSKMSPTETHYPTCKQELLAIKEAFEHWQHYLLAARFEVHSDHKSLRSVNSQSSCR
jgi:hypothetical protein